MAIYERLSKYILPQMPIFIHGYVFTTEGLNQTILIKISKWKIFLGQVKIRY